MTTKDTSFKIIVIVLSIIILVLLGISIYNIVVTVRDSDVEKAQDYYDELANLKNSVTESETETDASSYVSDSASVYDNTGESETTDGDTGETESETEADAKDESSESTSSSSSSSSSSSTSSSSKTNSDGILKKYASLYASNNDMVGWITVEGTIIDYPVVQSSIENANYYLRRLFDKTYSKLGTPYVQEDCDMATSNNIIIYGHHFTYNNKMFGELINYMTKNFWEKYPTFKFDTIYEEAEYEIAYVFRTTAYDNTGFRYYDYVNLDEDLFNEYIEKCAELSLYDTGVEVKYGDKLVTLSTCEQTQTNGRLVIVGRKIT